MSQLYARVFVQILDSSIAENYQVRHVFEDVLKLCDNGILDMTREAFARRTNIPLDVVEMAIEKLESPDPNSRDKKHDGRRLVRLDDRRNWGWEVVNWQEYESIRTRADASIRQARFRIGAPSPSHSPNPRAAEADSYSDSGVSRSITEHNNEALCQCESVYEAYPRKVAKAYALKCIARAIKQHGYEHVLSKTKEYAEARKGENMEFTPYPSTWFNQGRYNDDPVSWRHNVAGNPSNDIWRMKQIRDAKQILMDNLKEGGLVREDKEKYRMLKAEVAELNEKIARQA